MNTLEDLPENANLSLRNIAFSEKLPGDQSKTYSRYVVITKRPLIKQTEPKNWSARFNIRCSAKLKESIRELSFETRRSQNQLIVEILESFLYE